MNETTTGTIGLVACGHDKDERIEVCSCGNDSVAHLEIIDFNGDGTANVRCDVCGAIGKIGAQD